MSKPVKISTVLTRAAKHIEENGLAKGEYFKHRNGRRISGLLSIIEQAALAKEKGCKACTWGGLYVGSYVEGITPRDFDALTKRAAEYVQPLIDTSSAWGIAPWNDSDERTKDDVVQTLKDAAKAARKDGK